MAEAALKPILPYLEGPAGLATIARFLALVDQRGSDECWPWTGSSVKGYGRFKVTGYETRHANRVAWAIANGRDPGDLLVRHSCDNPPCCNPAHLLLGTHADNARDKVERGRWRGPAYSRGSANGAAKLSDGQLAILVIRLQAGQNNKQCAIGLPIGHSMVSTIRVGKMWREQTAALGWVPRAQFQRRTRARAA